MVDFRRILLELKKQERRLEKQLTRIRSAIGSLAPGGRTDVAGSRRGGGRKRKVSAAARAKMAAAQRARWARVRKEAQKG